MPDRVPTPFEVAVENIREALARGVETSTGDALAANLGAVVDLDRIQGMMLSTAFLLMATENLQEKLDAYLLDHQPMKWHDLTEARQVVRHTLDDRMSGIVCPCGACERLRARVVFAAEGTG